MLTARLVILPTLLIVSASALAADRPLVLIVDESLSMRSTDPDRFTVDSVQLAVACVRDGKRVAIVGFHQKSEILTPWTLVGGHPDRVAIRDMLDEKISFNGHDTKYLEALGAASQQLEAVNAPPDTRIIFFTDGNPDESPREIEREAAKFKDRGWVVDGLQLNVKGEEAQGLAALCRITLGTYRDVRKAEEVVEHFVRLTAAENDYFVFDTVKVEETQRVPVLPGTERIFYCVVKDKQGGRIADLTVDGQPFNLLDPRVFRYPKPGGTRKTNIDALNIVDPPIGTYAATFEGHPRAVYVTLSLPLRVEPYKLPDLVQENDQLKLGVALIPLKDNPQLLDFLGKETSAAARVKDAKTGAELAAVPLSPETLPKGVGHQGPYAVGWPPNVPRDAPRQYLVDYEVKLRGVWKLYKTDSFMVQPLKAPPPPAFRFGGTDDDGKGTGGIELITWAKDPVEKEIPFTMEGNASGSLSFEGKDGFAFPKPIEIGRDKAVLVRFQHERPGKHAGRFTCHLNKQPLATGELAVAALNYPWAGKDSLDLTGDAPTEVPKWGPGHPELPAQAFQAMTVHLADSDGRKADLVIDVKGFARLMPPAGLTDTVLTGNGVIHFGKLPDKPLKVTYRYAVPKVLSDWGKSPIQATLGPTATTALPPQRFEQTSGDPGTITVKVSDLDGPDGDRLLAEYDVRVQTSGTQSAVGTPVQVDLILHRGEDLKPGVYKGQVIVIHATAGGQTASFARPIEVTVQ